FGAVDQFHVPRLTLDGTMEPEPGGVRCQPLVGCRAGLHGTAGRHVLDVHGETVVVVAAPRDGGRDTTRAGRGRPHVRAAVRLAESDLFFHGPLSGTGADQPAGRSDHRLNVLCEHGVQPV